MPPPYGGPPHGRTAPLYSRRSQRSGPHAKTLGGAADAPSDRDRKSPAVALSCHRKSAKFEIGDSDPVEVRHLKSDLMERIAAYEEGWQEVASLGAVVKDTRTGLIDFLRAGRRPKNLALLAVRRRAHRFLPRARHRVLSSQAARRRGSAEAPQLAMPVDLRAAREAVLAFFGHWAATLRTNPIWREPPSEWPKHGRANWSTDTMST